MSVLIISSNAYLDQDEAVLAAEEEKTGQNTIGELNSFLRAYVQSRALHGEGERSLESGLENLGVGKLLSVSHSVLFESAHGTDFGHAWLRLGLPALRPAPLLHLQIDLYDQLRAILRCLRPSILRLGQIFMPTFGGS